MTPKSLFNLVLKILGIYLIVDALAVLPQLLSSFLYFSRADSIREGIWTLLLTVIIVFVYLLCAYYLIFKSDLLIQKLKLDKGFDQDVIPLNTHRSTILSIAIIVIGGLILVDEIPYFCRALFNYFQEKRMTYGQTKPQIAYAILSGTKIIIGYLLVVHQRWIVNFIERQRKKPSE